jgi:single-strand DNA-binding protein
MSEQNKISGAVHVVLDTQTFDSGFQKRVFVINTGGDYPQQIPVEVVKDKCQMLDGLQVGQLITATIDIRGNEYMGKYYANLVCWKWEVENASQEQQPAQGNQHKQDGHPLPQGAGQGGTTPTDTEDIPFSPFINI